MGKRLLSFLAICMFAVSMAFAQKTVTGIVIDDFGEPVIGASVLVKGTSNGGATDINGKFTIKNVPNSSSTLMVSYIGMRTPKRLLSNLMSQSYLKATQRILTT